MANGRTVGVWFSGKQLDDVQARAKAVAGGNESAYLKELVSRDLAGSFDAAAGSVLVDLAKRFHPGVADELEQLCTGPDGAKVNQAKVLARLLETVATTLRVVDQRDREQVHEETALQAELRRHKLIDGALEAVTDHLVAGGLLARVNDYLKQPSAYERRSKEQQP